MALSNQSVAAFDRTAADEGRPLPCCHTDLYPGEEHFREYKRAQKERERESGRPGQPGLGPAGMSSGGGATVRTGLSEMDETGVKGRARARSRSRSGGRDTEYLFCNHPPAEANSSSTNLALDINPRGKNLDRFLPRLGCMVPPLLKLFSISEISDMSNSRGIHLLSNSCPIHGTGI